MATYRPPRDCPVCHERLQLTQLGCPRCSTALSGQFEACDFCGLDDAELDMLRVFLASRGNMKDLERHLGVSYPTVRARFDGLLTKLGLADRPAADADGSDRVDPADPRKATLEALARGELSVDAAKHRLRSEG